MGRLLVFIALLLASACARGLTENEATMARDIFGPDFDTERVRIAQDLAFFPPPTSARVKVMRKSAGENFCRREPTPPRTQAPPGVAIGNTIHLRADIYQADAGLFWPNRLVFPHNFVFIHELTPVWQWQNRATTGYHPLAAASESFTRSDAYFYDPDRDLTFSEYGFEQQAAMVEDYLCHAMLDPANPRRDELRAILAPVLPIEELDARIGSARR